MIKELIEKAIRNSNNNLNQSVFTQEIIQHAKHCIKLTSKMDYNQNQYSEIEKYILDEDNNCPFVITGSSGAGKSSLLAYVAKMVNKNRFKLILYD